MKNNSYICGVHAKNILTLLGAGFFISVLLGMHRNLGLSIPIGFCTVRSEIVLGGTGVAQPFFCASYYNFSFMPRTMKDCKAGNNSTRTATFTHETSQSFYSNYLHEMQLKNRAYAFIIDRRLITEFTEFSHTYNHSGDNSSARIALILKDH